MATKFTRKIYVRAIDLEDLGIDLCFINTDDRETVLKAKADARLIAVAHELLDKLIAWQEVCDRITDQYSGVAAGVDFGALGRSTREVTNKAQGT